jgi:hypothetical protein
MNDITRELAFQLANGYCMHDWYCTEKATEIHHKLPNTIANKKKYPLFIESIFNHCPINHDCYMTKTLPTITEEQAKIYEKWLSMFRYGDL